MSVSSKFSNERSDVISRVSSERKERAGQGGDVREESGCVTGKGEGEEAEWARRMHSLFTSVGFNQGLVHRSGGSRNGSLWIA